MKRIVYLITKSDTGGAQKYVVELAAALPKDKFEAQILYGGKDVRFLSNKLEPHFLFINDWLAFFELIFRFRKLKPDIVHLNSSKAGVIGAVAAKIVGVKKVIFTAHGWVFQPQDNLSFLMRRFYIFLHKLAAKFQDKIICVSKYDYSLAIKYKIAPEKKLTIIHNGIDYAGLKFLTAEEGRRILSDKTGYNLAGYFIVASIGRLVKEKNYGMFIRAASILKSYPLRFLIISDGYERERLESMIKDNGLVDSFFLAGHMPDAYKYLKAVDLYVTTSVKEGLPFTVIEAMAAGLPMISTNIGGLPEFMSDRNQGNKLINIDDNKALAEAIISIYKLSSDERLKIGKNNFDYFIEEFSFDKLLGKTMRVYLD